MGASLRAGLLGGALATTVVLTSALSYAALVFSGGLSSGLGIGMTAALLATAFMSAALALFGSLRFEIGGPSGNAIAVVAVIAAAIEQALANRPPEVVMATVVVAIAISSAVSGVVLICLGMLRAGRWMRFIPYPVVGGMFGAAGWLMIRGSLRVIGTASTTELVVGLAFAALLIAATMRVRHPLVLPSLLAGGIVAFYAVVAARGLSIESLRDRGWLFDVPHGSPFAMPWNPNTLQHVIWSVFPHRFDDVAAIVVVVAISVLLNTSVLELMTQREADFDRELRVQGLANLTSGLFGGFVCVGAPNATMLSYRSAGASRIPAVVVTLTSLAILFGGRAIVDAVPRFVFGALIFTTGFGFLYEWCVRTARRLPLYDYLSILAIVAVVIRFGYVAGVAAGFLIGCIIFVVTYSHVRVIKHDLSGVEFRSGVIRSPEERDALAAHGDAIRILVLQGFIFFGMADRLQRAVRELLDGATRRPELMIMDFRAVNGLDSSAVSSFLKIRQLTERDGVELIFTGMSSDLQHQWKSGLERDIHIQHFEEIDAALEYCEAKVLAQYAAHGFEDATLSDWLRRELGDESFAQRFAGLLELRHLSEGEVLCAQGSPADAMFFIERGRVAVSLQTDSGNVRLRSLGDRTILGEMGLYRSSVRSASVLAERPSVVHMLTRESFENMERDDPALAAAFHAAIVRTLADRLEFESAMVASLQR